MRDGRRGKEGAVLGHFSRGGGQEPHFAGPGDHRLHHVLGDGEGGAGGGGEHQHTHVGAGGVEGVVEGGGEGARGNEGKGRLVT